jgi:hypothetical protein
LILPDGEAASYRRISFFIVDACDEKSIQFFKSRFLAFFLSIRGAKLLQHNSNS